MIYIYDIYIYICTYIYDIYIWYICMIYIYIYVIYIYMIYIYIWMIMMMMMMMIFPLTSQRVSGRRLWTPCPSRWWQLAKKNPAIGDLRMRIQIGFILAARYVYIKPMVYICLYMYIKKSTCIMCIYTWHCFFCWLCFKKCHKKRTSFSGNDGWNPVGNMEIQGLGGTHKSNPGNMTLCNLLMTLVEKVQHMLGQLSRHANGDMGSEANAGQHVSICFLGCVGLNPDGRLPGTKSSNLARQHVFSKKRMKQRASCNGTVKSTLQSKYWRCTRGAWPPLPHLP